MFSASNYHSLHQVGYAHALNNFTEAQIALLRLIRQEHQAYPSLVKAGEDVYSNVQQAYGQLINVSNEKVAEQLGILTEVLLKTKAGIENPADIDNFRAYEALNQKIQAIPSLGKKSWPKLVLGAGVAFVGVLAVAASLTLIAMGWTAPWGIVSLVCSFSMIGSGVSLGLHGRQRGVAKATMGFFKEMSKKQPIKAPVSSVPSTT